MTGGDNGTGIMDEGWRVRVSGHPQALAEACAAAGLSPNALRWHDLTLDAPDAGSGDGVGAAAASIEWPSYFCDKTGLVLVLAYLVRNHLPLDLDMFLDRPGAGTSHYQLHPPLDPHTRGLLKRLNPQQARALDDLQDRAEAVFSRLRAGYDPDL